MLTDLEASAEGPPKPAKRTSVVDMWRKKEQAMLEKQGAPAVAPSPVRRSFKFEEKKHDVTNNVTKTEPTPAPTSTLTPEAKTNEVNTWKKQESSNAVQCLPPDSNVGDVGSNFGGTTNTITHRADTISKGESNYVSPSEKTSSSKNKFGIVGQRHTFRPATLQNHSSYQEQAGNDRTDSFSPLSMNSGVLSEAFDDVVKDEQGEKLSAELTSTRRGPQSHGLQQAASRQSSASKASQYASLQVSDSASIPQDVHGIRSQPFRKNDQKDEDDSLVSGLSSPGSPAVSNQQKRQNRKYKVESPREEKQNEESVIESIDDGQMEANLDSEGVSTDTSALTGPEIPRPKSGLDKASEAVITDEFVTESDTNVSAFQKAVQKMSLADLAYDMSDEAKAVFGNIDMGKVTNDFHQGIAAAQETFNRFVQGTKPTTGEATPRMKEPGSKEGEVVEEGSQTKGAQNVEDEDGGEPEKPMYSKCVLETSSIEMEIELIETEKVDVKMDLEAQQVDKLVPRTETSSGPAEEAVTTMPELESTSFSVEETAADPVTSEVASFPVEEPPVETATSTAKPEFPTFPVEEVPVETLKSTAEPDFPAFPDDESPAKTVTSTAEPAFPAFPVEENPAEKWTASAEPEFPPFPGEDNLAGHWMPSAETEFPPFPSEEGPPSTEPEFPAFPVEEKQAGHWTPSAEPQFATFPVEESPSGHWTSSAETGFAAFDVFEEPVAETVVSSNEPEFAPFPAAEAPGDAEVAQSAKPPPVSQGRKQVLPDAGKEMHPVEEEVAIEVEFLEDSEDGNPADEDSLDEDSGDEMASF
eukprot:scaffold6124_cov122-Cylindrotheca_fusiformis.AAC.12